MAARWGWFPAVGLSVAGLLVVSSPITAEACYPKRAAQANYGFASWDRAYSGITAVKSNIREYDPFVAPNSDVTAWIMLYTYTGNGYAQVGWEKPDGGSPFYSPCHKASGTNRCVFTEEQDSSGFVNFGYSAAQPINASTTYEVHYEYYTGVLAYTYWSTAFVLGVMAQLRGCQTTRRWPVRFTIKAIKCLVTRQLTLGSISRN